MKELSSKQQNRPGSTPLKQLKKRHSGAGTEKSITPETYWEEDSNEQEWREDIGNSGRKPSLDEYDKWDR
ncbi:MAG: hypothetical protein DMG65_21045 [Candidatus Angelobacter sp. Gp1-AA117]|nr:MAG: hypothetical protein DMG65_21045 [Candidatus Angelobacter sp. Gp1-AA117]